MDGLFTAGSGLAAVIAGLQPAQGRLAAGYPQQWRGSAAETYARALTQEIRQVWDLTAEAEALGIPLRAAQLRVAAELAGEPT